MDPQPGGSFTSGSTAQASTNAKLSKAAVIWLSAVLSLVAVGLVVTMIMLGRIGSCRQKNAQKMKLAIKITGSMNSSALIVDEGEDDVLAWKRSTSFSSISCMCAA